MDAVHTKLAPRELAIIEPLLDKVVNDCVRRRRILALVQDSLGQLRLDLKYLMFDLEATKREKADLERRCGL